MKILTYQDRSPFNKKAMIKKIKDPDCLITEAEEYMLAVGYSPFTMVRVKRAWLFVRSFMKSRDLNCYSVDIAKLAVDQYLKDCISRRKRPNRYQKFHPQCYPSE